MEINLKKCYFIALLILVAGLYNCSDKKESPKPAPVPAIELKQSTLDSIITPLHLNFSGRFTDSSTKYSQNFPHDGTENDASTTIRDIFYRNVFNSSGKFAPGTIRVKHVYVKDSSGKRGELKAIFVMNKQRDGYFPSGGDWEYFIIDGKSASTKNPNGLLTQKVIDPKKDAAFCAGCHKDGKKEFLFRPE